MGFIFNSFMSIDFFRFSVYINLDYLFWKKIDIEDIGMDRNSYPWIIWYMDNLAAMENL